MQKRSLADAKTHLSAVVNAAQHRGQRTLILRHGKPAAAIVPLDVAMVPPSVARERRGRRLPAATVHALFGAFAKASRRRSAVADLLSSRR